MYKLAALCTIFSLLTFKAVAVPGVNIENQPYTMPNGSRLVPIVPTEVTIADPVQAIRFLPNTTILVAMTGGTLYFWDVESGKLLQRIRNSVNNIAIAISPDGKTIALSDQQQIELLNSNGAKTGNTLSASLTITMGFDRSSKTLLTFDEGGNLKLWDVSSGKLIKILGTFKYPFYDRASLSPKGDLAAVAGTSSIVIYDTATDSVVQDIKQDTSKVKSVDGMVFSPDGNSIISEESTWSGGPSFIAEWDAITGKLLKEVGVGQDQYWINLSPDGLHLISGSFNPGQIRLWDTSTWKVLESWPDDGFGNSRQQFSPNGQYIAFVTANGAVQLISTITGTLIETLFATADNWVSFTPNGRFVSSDNVRNQLRIQTAGGIKALDPLVQRNRLDTLAAVNGITSEGLGSTVCLDSNFPLGPLDCDDGRLGSKPTLITDTSAYFTVIQTAKSGADAQRRVNELIMSFPNQRFGVYPPYADQKIWMIVMASFTDVDHARESAQLAKRLGVAKNPIVWKIPHATRVPDGWDSENIQQVVMRCLASGSQTILQMYTCSGSVVTPEILQQCIKDGICEFDLTPVAAIELLESQKLSWNSPLIVQAESPNLNAIQTCLSAHPNDAPGFMDCSANAVLGTSSAAACRDKAQDERSLSECLLQAAGIEAGQLDCLVQKGKSDPSSCLDTKGATQWLQAKGCLAKYKDPFEAAQSCLLSGVDPNAVKMAKCLSANRNDALGSLSCASEWPELTGQAKVVRCLKGIDSGARALLSCASTAGIRLDPSVIGCLQSPSTDATNWVASCLSGVNNPAVACFSNFSESSEDIMTCLANGNPATRDALAAVRCIASGNDASDLIASCMAGLVKDPKARQALACAAQSGGDVGQLAGCAAAPLLGGEGGRLLSCATQSQSYAGLALCVAGPKMDQEWMIAAQCAASSGGVPVTTAACTAGWLTMRELGKCLKKIGGDGCFGPDNSIVKAVNNAVNDITKGPGPNNEIVKAMTEIGKHTEIKLKDVSIRTPVGGHNALLQKAGRDFDQAKNKAGKWLGARLGIKGL